MAGCATGLRYTPNSLVPHFARPSRHHGGMRYRAALHPEFPCPAFRATIPPPWRDALPGCATPRIPLSRISRDHPANHGGMRYRAALHPEFPCPAFRATIPPPWRDALPGCATPRIPLSRISRDHPANHGGMRYRAALHPEFPCPAFRATIPPPWRDALPGCATPRIPLSRISRDHPANHGGMRYRAALHPEFPCPAFRATIPPPWRDALPGCATPRIPLSRISRDHPAAMAGCATGLRYTPNSLVPHFARPSRQPWRDALPGCATPRIPLPPISRDHPATMAGCATGLPFTPNSLVPHFVRPSRQPWRDALPGCATPQRGVRI